MIITAAAMSDKLRDLRIRAKFTQDQLADYLGLSSPAISRIENGRQLPDAVTYENWLLVCSVEVVKFIYIHDGGSKQHA